MEEEEEEEAEEEEEQAREKIEDRVFAISIRLWLGPLLVPADRPPPPAASPLPPRFGKLSQNGDDLARRWKPGLFLSVARYVTTFTQTCNARSCS